MRRKAIVSVIMPVYNGAVYLDESINSVLSQTLEDIELIIIDDGSTDQSLRIAEKWERSDQRIRVLTHEGNVNKGVSTSRYKGVSNASGEFISFCDADDILLPDKLLIQSTEMKKHPEAVLSHTGVTAFGADVEFLKHFESRINLSSESYIYRLQNTPDWLSGNRICNSTVMARSGILKQVDFSFEQKFQVEDWVLWSLLSFNGSFLFLPGKLTRYRYYPESATGKVRMSRLTAAYSMLEFYTVLQSKVGWEHPVIKLKLMKKIYKTFKILKQRY